MSTTAKVILSCVGVFIGGITSYYEVHSAPGDVVVSSKFWIGMAMAGLAPLGSFFLGLLQKSPWDGTPAATKP